MIVIRICCIVKFITRFKLGLVTPWFSCSSATLTHSKLETVEGVLVDDVELGHQGHGKLHHSAQVGVTPFSILEGIDRQNVCQ